MRQQQDNSGGGPQQEQARVSEQQDTGHRTVTASTKRIRRRERHFVFPQRLRQQQQHNLLRHGVRPAADADKIQLHLYLICGSRASLSLLGAKAMAALTTLASQAKGLTSVLQRPKFLTTLEVRAPSFQLQRKPEPVTKSHSSSAATSASDDMSDEIEERRSVDEITASSSSSSSSSSMSFAVPRRSRLESEDTTTVLLPWELRDELGDVVENVVVREKVFELTMYRRTFVEDADGEDDYTFQYAKYKDVARRLLHSDPNLRDKYTTIVESPMAFVISEETFWRNFFLRCNAIRVDADLPPYLPPVVLSSMAAVASFQRFRRDMFLKTQRSSAELEKLRRSLLQPKRPTTASMDESDLTLIDCELGELELDLDGEIERELMRRRPSRAVEYHKSSKATADTGDAAQDRASEVAP